MTAPVRREVIVNAVPERAFELFTGHIGAWWPLDKFGVFNDGTVAFEDGRIIERSNDRESVWGDVTAWEPPDALGFTWHPGYGVEQATAIRVTFTAAEDKTLVTLVHTGWERMTNPDASAEEYTNGWPRVLAGFAALVERSHE
jgi:Activator of Hsp90 ATPase homolog 1-like protein